MSVVSDRMFSYPNTNPIPTLTLTLSITLNPNPTNSFACIVALYRVKVAYNSVLIIILELDVSLTTAAAYLIGEENQPADDDVI